MGWTNSGLQTSPLQFSVDQLAYEMSVQVLISNPSICMDIDVQNLLYTVDPC